MFKSVSAALCGAAAMLAASSAGAASLLVNGGFEGAPADNFPAQHYTRGIAPEGWSALPGLEVPDIISAGYAQGGPPFQVLLTAQEGSRFLDTNGASPTGGLYQDVEGLEAGTAVSLSYWWGQWAQNSAGVLNIALIDPATLAVIDAATISVPFNNTLTSSAWNNLTLSGLAPASGKVRVQFSANSGATDRGGPGLDNLVLTGTLAGGVPEPGAWALMILGFGAAGTALRRRRVVV